MATALAASAQSPAISAMRFLYTQDNTDLAP